MRAGQLDVSRGYYLADMLAGSWAEMMAETMDMMRVARRDMMMAETMAVWMAVWMVV